MPIDPEKRGLLFARMLYLFEMKNPPPALQVPESEGGLGKKFNHRRALILGQFCAILLDIPFVFLGFAACLTGVLCASCDDETDDALRGSDICGGA